LSSESLTSPSGAEVPLVLIGWHTPKLPNGLKHHVVRKGNQGTDLKTHTPAPNHVTNAKPATGAGLE